MSSRPSLGVAVVGLGVGEQHARAYCADPRCRLHWVYDLDQARAQALAAELGVAGVAPDFEAILNSPEVQLVSIASYDDDHAGQVLQALNAGKHVFVEKPLCQMLDQLQAIKAAWAQHGGKVKLASNLVLRAAPLYRWLQQRVAAGEFGEIYAFDGDYLYGRLHKITGGWRAQTENYSVLEGGGIHLIDLMLWLTGQRPSTVAAMGNRIATRGTRFRYNDFAAALLQFPSGLIGHITANFGCVHRHQHVMRVFGTRGTFLYDDAGPRVHVTHDSAVAPDPVQLNPLPTSKGDLIPAFVEAVLSDADLAAETQQVFDGLSVTLACDRAMQNSSIEEVGYV